jgi:hypothetical protein
MGGRMKLIYNGEYDYLDLCPEVIQLFEDKLVEGNYPRARYGSARNAMAIVITGKTYAAYCRIHQLYSKNEIVGYSITIKDYE